MTILGIININVYIYLFINSLIFINIFKFFIIIKIVDSGFININFYMYLYTLIINFFYLL